MTDSDNVLVALLKHDYKQNIFYNAFFSSCLIYGDREVVKKNK